MHKIQNTTDKIQVSDGLRRIVTFLIIVPYKHSYLLTYLVTYLLTYLLTLTGGLHFANVEMEDERGGLRYVCVVHNAVLRNLVQGDDQIIRPHFVRGN